ncbi:MAG: DUF4350 domain-containing protein [Verrucomicrobia bacterium]|nr:MAG: DUF4350 domain-containing protein [Verrucomicrobiota bacterium]
MKHRLPILLMLVGALAFTAGVVYLFLLRFEAGDVFPPYSSLRSDPLGTMALYESLAKLPGLSVRRDFSESSKLPEERDVTYLHIAAEVYSWREMPKEMFTEIEAFAARGGRLAIVFKPVMGWQSTILGVTITNSAASTNLPGFKGSKKSGGKLTPINFVTEDTLKKYWGVTFGQENLKKGEDDVYEPARVANATDLHLPPRLDWHSPVVFTKLDPAWRVIYSRGTNSVVIERHFGRGSVVMATDSYFLSNEAMWKDRQPALLAWLMASGKQVVFDEAHLGVTESSGVAVLMRKYRLHGVLAGLVLLAGLFVWKNSISLVPPLPAPAQGRFVAGKDAAAGFVNLLRRNVPPREILEVCFAEWTKSFGTRRALRISSVDQAQTIMESERTRPARERNAVAAYQKICAALKSRTTHHSTRIQQPETSSPTAISEEPIS